MNPTDQSDGDELLPKTDSSLELFTSKEVPPLVEAVAMPVPEQPRPGFGAAIAFLWCLGFLLAAQIVPGVVGLMIYLVASGEIGNLIPGKEAELSPAAMQFLMGLTHITAIAGVILLLRWKVGRAWTRKLAIRIPEPQHVVLVLIGVPGLLVVSHALEQVVRHLVPSISEIFRGQGLPNVEAAIETSSTWPGWLAVLLIAVGPAIWEEMFCRGFLGRGLSARYGFVGGVLATSFFFGLIHVEPPQAVMAMLLGTVLHAVYILSRSLLLPMLIHFLNNALVVLAISDTAPVPFLKTLEAAYDRSPLVFTLSAIVLVAAVGYALYETRARLRPSSEGMPVWEPAHDTVALPPSGSSTVVVHSAPSPATVALVAAAAGLFGLAWFAI